MTRAPKYVLYQRRLLQKLGKNKLESAETLCEHIHDCIHSAARQVSGEQRRGREGGKKYIWSEEIEAAVRRKKNSYLTALSTKKPKTGNTERRIDEMLNV